MRNDNIEESAGVSVNVNDSIAAIGHISISPQYSEINKNIY